MPPANVVGSWGEFNLSMGQKINMKVFSEKKTEKILKGSKYFLNTTLPLNYDYIEEVVYCSNDGEILLVSEDGTSAYFPSIIECRQYINGMVYTDGIPHSITSGFISDSLFVEDQLKNYVSKIENLGDFTLTFSEADFTIIDSVFFKKKHDKNEVFFPILSYWYLFLAEIIIQN